MDKNVSSDMAKLRQQAELRAEEREREREQFEQEKIAEFKQAGMGEDVQRAMEATLQRLRDAKPKERRELSRRYAVTITEFEKVIAYFRVYVTGDS